MTGDALAKAFESVITGVTVYKDNLPADPSFPYVYVVTNFPTVAERSFTRDAQSRMLRSRTTVGGLSASSVRVVAQKLSDSLDGARLSVAGWSLGRVESEPNDQPMQVDLDITIPNIGHPLYQVFDWKVAGSRA